MKKSRRKFISSLIGSVAVGGLAGCMESKDNQSDGNETNNNSNSEDVVNETDRNQVNRDLSPYVESFTYEFNCEEDKEQVKNIGKSDTNEYTFSGIENFDSDCYDVTVNADIINNRLNVQIQLNQSNEISCENCQSQLSYTGVVRIDDDQDVNISEVNIVSN